MLGLLALPYLVYLTFVVRLNRGPVDFETFWQIGRALLEGGQVYGENSYYPLPMVMIFAGLASLPRALGLVLWLATPVVAAVVIARWQPWVLLFAPVASHFLGGQSAVFGMIGLWGYQRWAQPDKAPGGVWLGLTLLKPQLGVVLVAHAAIGWWRYWRSRRRVPLQAVAFAVSAVALYLPAFIVWPVWPLAWLSHPRPLFERAMSGLIPRGLIAFMEPRHSLYWLLWLALSGGLLLVIWRLQGRRMALAPLVLASYVISPLVHDYDLIQLVPLVQSRWLRWGAVLLSLPGWVVMVTAYAQDRAWVVFTLIAPGLLGLWLAERRTLEAQTLTDTSGRRVFAPANS